MANTPEAAPAPKKSPMMMVIVILLVLVLAGGGFLGFQMMSGDGKHKEVKPAPALELGSVVDVFGKNDLTIRLNDKISYLQTNVSFAFTKSFDVKLLKDSIDALKSAVINVLLTKSPEELDTTEGRNAVKKEIATKGNAIIRQYIPDLPIATSAVHMSDPNADPLDSNTGPIIQVYFTKFALQ